MPAVVGCGKRPYPTRRAARDALTRIHRDGRPEQRHYHCGLCVAWHLTKQPRKARHR